MKKKELAQKMCPYKKQECRPECGAVNEEGECVRLQIEERVAVALETMAKPFLPKDLSS